MSEPARIAFVCEGDAETHHAFSGTAKQVVDGLRALGHVVTTFDARPGRFSRYVNAALSFHPDRRVWRTRFRHGRAAFLARSARVRAAIAPHLDRTDVVLQIGPVLEPPGAGRVPFTLYCDWNMAASMRFRENPYSSAHGMRPADAEAINGRQAEIYKRAAAVFTLSDRLRESFLDDYRLPPDRVVAVHAGPNIDLARVPPRPPRRDARPPTVLFTGKEFERKGGDVLLAAFREVRRQLPDARLLILGPRRLDCSDPGVDFRGFVDKNAPGGMESLAGLYSDSDVFCLPTRLEPLGIVVLEAMAFGLPCVTSNVWAVPEMVVDGETGFTVPPDDPPALADRLLRLLRDSARARQMGEAGRERLHRLFTWPVAVRKMHERLQRVAREG